MKTITIKTSLACALLFNVFYLVGCSESRGSSYTEDSLTYRLYFLAGQSNMDGYGYVSELPEALRVPVDRVFIFKGETALDGGDGGEGVWSPLEPGFGKGSSMRSGAMQLSNRFGPELTFGLEMSSRDPDTRVALIKYALGGSGLAPNVGYGSWHPSDRNGNRVNQYDHALKTIRNAFSESDVDGDGIPDRLVPAGVIWMQGESDANHSQEVADEYLVNLTHLMQMLRSEFGIDSLPIVVGKITDSGMADDGSVMDFIETVQIAQSTFTATDPCATLVSVTDDLNYRNDAWHYDTDGFLRLGTAFADAALELEQECLVTQ